MNKYSYFGASQCLGMWLHRYKIHNEWEEGVEEICEICFDRQFYKIINGQIDNIEYLRHHERDILTPQASNFELEYL